MDAFKGDGAKFLPKKTYKDKLTRRQRQGPHRPLLLRRRPHQRRHLRRLPGATRPAHRRHVRVEGRAVLRSQQRRQLRRACRGRCRRSIAGIKNVDTIIPGHSPMMTPKDLQEYQRFTADLLSHATNAMKAGKSVDETTAVVQGRQVSGLQERARQGGGPGGVRRAQEIAMRDEDRVPRAQRSPRCSRRFDAQAGRRPAGARVPPPAPELDEPRRGDRFLREGVSEHVEGHVGRDAGAEVAEQRARAVHESRAAAGDAAADRGLALRLARARTSARRWRGCAPTA